MGGVGGTQSFAHIVFSPQERTGGKYISRSAFDAEAVDIIVLRRYIVGQEEDNH